MLCNGGALASGSFGGMISDPMINRLHDHPEGASEMPQDPDGSRSICSIQSCKEFVEVCDALS